MKRRYQQSESENRGESRELPREVTGGLGSKGWRASPV